MKISDYKINDKNAIEITKDVVKTRGLGNYAFYSACDCSRANKNSTAAKILISCSTFKSPAEIFGIEKPYLNQLKGMAKAGLLNVYTIPELCRPGYYGVTHYMKTWYKITPNGDKVLKEIINRG